MELKDFISLKVDQGGHDKNSMKHSVSSKQAQILDDNVVQVILTRYPEENKCLMLKTFVTIGIFCVFRIDNLDRLE